MKLILTALILLKSVCTFACYCGPLPPFRNKEDLKTFDFIALAEVKSASVVSKIENIETGEFKITIIELFKGNRVTAVYDEFHNTSCNITLREGEQWLLFGYVSKGRIAIGSCSYSQPYRDISKTREWNYQSAINNLNVLRTIYDHNINTTPNEKVFYPNGNLEIQQNIKNKKLDGLRKIYYPTGQLYVKEEFKNGEHIGQREVYSVSGQLLRHEEYHNGLIKRLFDYEDTTFTMQMLLITAKLGDPSHFERKRTQIQIDRAIDSLKKTIDWGHVFLTTEYRDDGRSYAVDCYFQTGALRYKGYVDLDKGLSEFYHYLEDGKLEYYVKKDMKNDQDVEYDYKEDGTKREFVKKCLLCKVYFDEIASASKPEKVFIE